MFRIGGVDFERLLHVFSFKYGIWIGYIIKIVDSLQPQNESKCAN